MSSGFTFTLAFFSAVFLTAADGHVAFQATVHEFRTSQRVRKHVATYWESHFQDGSVARMKKVHLGSKQDELSTLFTSSPDGTDIQSVPELKIKSTYHHTPAMKQADLQRRAIPASRCAAIGSRFPEVSEGSSVRLGRQVWVYSTGNRVGPRYRSELAPDMGCYPLYSRTEFLSQSGRLEEMVEKARN